MITVSRKLIMAPSIEIPHSEAKDSYLLHSRDEVTYAKRYLCRPALAEIYGLGMEPFYLYQAVAFDKLNCMYHEVSRMVS